MATCNCGDVSITCVGGCGCICIVGPPRRCSVYCFTPSGPIGGPLPVATMGDLGPIRPGDKINVNLNGVTLEALALALDKRTKDDIFVPIGKRHVTKTGKKSGTLQDIVKHFGLHLAKRPGR